MALVSKQFVFAFPFALELGPDGRAPRHRVYLRRTGFVQREGRRVSALQKISGQRIARKMRG